MLEIIPAILTESYERFELLLTHFLPLNRHIHIDVLDNTMVPGETIYPFDLAYVLSETGQNLLINQAKSEVHLMVDDPFAWIPQLAPDSSPLIVHWSRIGDCLTDFVGQAKKAGINQVSLAVNITDNVAELTPEVIEQVSLIQLMAVQPGKQGQAFDNRVLDRCQELRQRFPKLHIQIDGGVNEETIRQCARAGATSVVVGSALANAADPAVAYRNLELAAKME